MDNSPDSDQTCLFYVTVLKRRSLGGRRYGRLLFAGLAGRAFRETPNNDSKGD